MDSPSSGPYTLGESARVFASPQAEPTALPVGSPQKIRKRALKQATSSFQAQADELARLQGENASLRSNLTGANLSILHLQALYQESQLSTDHMLRAANEKAELPWDSPRTREF
jgi:hypothetical protein